MIYSIPYVLLLLLYGFLAVYSYNNRDDETVKHKIGVWCVIIFIFFYGLRGFTCDDWINYYPAFQKCSYEYINLNPFDYSFEWSFEPGFTLLMCLCKTIANSFHFFVFVCTTINTLLLYNFLHKRVANIPLGFILFLCFGGYGLSTNLMRNSIAILIFINAVDYIFKRQPLPYFGMCLLALSFHSSSVFYFPLYFFFHKKCNKWIYLALFALGNIVFILHIPIFLKIAEVIVGDSEGRLQKMLEIYTTGNFAEMKTLSIGYLERLFSGIIVFCYYDKLIEVREENKIFINAFIGYFLTALMLSEFSTISLRMSYLFMFSYWILWNDLIKCFFYENNRKLFLSFIGLYCVLKMIISTDMVTSKYDNVLFGIKSYEERLYIHNRYSED